MANMIDYLAWRGEFGFEVTPWNPVDALLMANLSYLGFHSSSDGRGWTLSEAKRIDLVQEEKSAAFAERKRMFDAMAESNRFGGCRIHHYIALTDPEAEMQFSAVCADMPDGTMCVAFRGTDNTIVGWREDFNMAYQTIVPAQEAAVYYLAQAAEQTDRPLRLMGHSKGGNLAVYAAAGATPEVRERIESIWAFDAPGMNVKMSQAEGYLLVKDKIRAYIPQSSVIGLLMEYFQPYTVVHSNALGISQHDPFTWQVYGARFEEVEGGVDHAAVVMKDTLHDWLENSTPEQRGGFVDVLFQYVESTKATRLSDLTNEKLKPAGDGGQSEGSGSGSPAGFQPADGSGGDPGRRQCAGTGAEPEGRHRGGDEARGSGPDRRRKSGGSRFGERSRDRGAGFAGG